MMFREEYKLFGILTVLVVQRTEYELVESEESEVAETESHEVGGGSAHNFTLAPEFVDQRYLPWEEDKKQAIGFRRPT